ncbi:MAG TPA: hypothetical protein VE441_06740 [Mycobacterium sp.]|nr:hypothetical protein [Mycobacterium sp.]
MALLGCAGLFAIANMPSAAAVEPDRVTFSFANSDVLDCGSFQDHYTDFFDASSVVFSNSTGAQTRVVIHWEHRSNDTNSVTGLTLHEHGHFTETIDLGAGTDTITGNEEIATRPGTGVVVQDVGRVVTDENGDLVFFAGGRNHSEILIGDAVLCGALS